MKKIAILFVLSLCSVEFLSAQDIPEFERVYNAIVDGVETSAFLGGFSNANPTLFDIDSDGDLDLFLGWEYGIIFFKNTGDSDNPSWELISRNYFSVPDKYLSVDFADLDNDGDADALIGGFATTLYYVKNTGTAASPAWAAAVSDFQGIDQGSVRLRPVFGDLDNDNDYDLIVAASDGKVTLYWNKGTAGSANYSSSKDLMTIPNNPRPDLADIDNDGDLDFFLGSNNEILFFKNNGTPENMNLAATGVSYFSDIIKLKAEPSPDFADLNGDQVYDLLVFDAHNGGLSYYENSGTKASANWAAPIHSYIFIDDGYLACIDLFDTDSDSDIDMLYTGATGVKAFNLIKNTGSKSDASWKLTTNNNINLLSAPFDHCDIDNDGDQDIITSTHDGTSLTLIENTGTAAVGNWKDKYIENYGGLTFTGGYGSPAICDIDKDKDFDLFIGTHDGKIIFLENTGTNENAVWASPVNTYQNIVIDGIRIKPELADMDEDSDYDLIIGVYHKGMICYYENTGTPTTPVFTHRSDNFVELESTTYDPKPKAADIDNDGDMDLFIATNDGGIYFYRNITGDQAATSELFQQTLWVTIYPVPASNLLTISFEGAVASRAINASVLTLDGKKVYSVKLNDEVGSSTFSIDISELPAGMYFMKIESDGFLNIAKFIKGPLK